MKRLVTSRTQRYTIANVEAGILVLCPPVKVMGDEIPSSGVSAYATGIFVSTKNFVSPQDVLPNISVFHPIFVRQIRIEIRVFLPARSCASGANTALPGAKLFKRHRMFMPTLTNNGDHLVTVFNAKVNKMTSFALDVGFNLLWRVGLFGGALFTKMGAVLPPEGPDTRAGCGMTALSDVCKRRARVFIFANQLTSLGFKLFLNF